MKTKSAGCHEITYPIVKLSSDPLINGLLHCIAGARAAISVGITKVMQQQREKQCVYVGVKRGECVFALPVSKEAVHSSAETR